MSMHLSLKTPLKTERVIKAKTCLSQVLASQKKRKRMALRRDKLEKEAQRMGITVAELVARRCNEARLLVENFSFSKSSLRLADRDSRPQPRPWSW